MPEAFDPYHVWLGIPPEEQPANRYRLLGIRAFESNPDVIDNAADRQTAHLRTFQAGKHAALTERLLNEVATARVCLLNPQSKAAYDQQLRATMAARGPQSALGSDIGRTPMPAPGGSQIRYIQPPNLPVARAIEPPTPQIAAPQAAPAAASNWDSLIGAHEIKRTNPGGRSGTSAARRQANQRLVYAGVGGGLLLLAGIAALLYAINANADATLIFDWPAGDRAGATLAVDNQPVAIPASGAWEFRCPPGEHRIVAQRPAFKFQASISLAAGDRTPIVPDWKPKPVPSDRQGVAIVAPGRPTLSIDWPANDRDGATLMIDSREQPVDRPKLEFALNPGQHTLQFVREGFQPIDETVEIAATGVTEFTPLWTLKVAAPSTHATAPNTAPAPSTDPAEQPAATSNDTPKRKLAVPSDAEQTRIAKQLDEAYPTEPLPEKQRALAEQLFALADQPGTSADERYMLLTKAIGLATKAWDLNSALHGIDLLGAAYEIDSFEMKQKLIDDAVKLASSPEQATAVVTAAELIIEQALTDERYDTALAIADLANKAINKLPVESRAKKDAAERLARGRREITVLQTASAAAVEAQTALDKAPDDPEANTSLGRWYCLYKGDWDRGLPLLAKGKDARLKSLAEQELAGNLELKPQLELADGWWDVQKEPGLPRDSARLHAAEIYQLMLPNLQAGLKKTAVEKRLAEIESIKRSAAGPKRQIDLLKLVDVKRDTVLGDWTIRNGELVSGGPQFFVRIAFPYQPPEEYDFEISFTRLSGNDIIGQICVGGGHEFMWGMSGWGGNISGFEMVDGKGASQNATRTEFGVAVGRRHTSVVRVRRAGVEAWVDGKLIDRWKTDYRDFNPADLWALPDRSALGITTHHSPTVFHSAKVTEITGTGKVLSQPIAGPTMKQGTAVKSGPDSSRAFPRGQWVDVLRLVDTTKHAVKGNWSRNGSDVSCEPEEGARIRIPVAVNGSYDLEVEFTRSDGDCDVNTIVTAGGQQCSILLSMAHGVSGLDRIDGKRPTDEGNPTTIRPGMLVNGHRYRLLVNVRAPRSDYTSIDVSLDGKPYLPHWEGNPSSLSVEAGWRMPNMRELGLASWDTRVTFHSMRLRLVAGRAIAESVKSEIKSDVRSSPSSSMKKK